MRAYNDNICSTHSHGALRSDTMHKRTLCAMNLDIIIKYLYFAVNNFFKCQALMGLTGNISPCHIASGCVRTPRRSSTSARCRGHSHVPHDRLCRSCSNTALFPFWVLCSLWKYGHSCGNCSTLYLKQGKALINNADYKQCNRSSSSD